MVGISSVSTPQTPDLVWKPLAAENRDALVGLIAEMERIDNSPYRISPTEVDQILATNLAGLGGWNQDSRLVAYAIIRVAETTGVQAICPGRVAAGWRKRGMGAEILS